MNRREFLEVSALLPLLPGACMTRQAIREEIVVNDIHSGLNPTRVGAIVSPGSTRALSETVRSAGQRNEAISIAGGRHAMGAQQFGTGTTLIDMRAMNQIIHFDRERGLIEVEAGTEWPELIGYLGRSQQGSSRSWGIAQKQTGADRLSLGGALAANVHGRGLRLRPIIQDVESFELVNAQGETIRCSRSENRELFALVIGGYGLFGIVSKVVLRLVPRQKVERVVEIRNVDDVMGAFVNRIAAGYTYGDFQFSIDDASEDFMRKGVFACYRPVDPATPMAPEQKELAASDWIQLLTLAHADKSRAFDRYAGYYLSTSGQIYWSDTQQLGIYPDGYHRLIDQTTKAASPGSEIISEIYVPRERLADFMLEARDDFRKNKVEVIYGTVRLIEQDDESFLAWAKKPYACIIFNLHTAHTPAGIAHSAEAFRRLIDMAIRREGSYYLTYHKFARRDQVESCYPQFSRFLEAKSRYDRNLRFQSDWWRHYRKMFG